MFAFLFLIALPQSTIAAPTNEPASVEIAPTRVGTYRDAGTVLAMIDARLDAHGQGQLAGKGYDADTHGHEGVHMLNSVARNKVGGRANAFYLGDGKCAILKEPRTTIGRAAQFVPEHLRGSRFNLYLVSQRGGWDARPLYIFDEWSAYIAGAACSISQAEEDLPYSQNTDAAVGQLEFVVYALAVHCAVEADDPGYLETPDGEQFRRVIAWGIRKSEAQYHRCQSLPGLKWHHEIQLSHPAAAKLRAAMERCCGKSRPLLPQSAIERPRLPQSTIQPAPKPVAAAPVVDDCPTGT